MEIIVTRIDNIQKDDEGKFLLDEEGGLLLYDEENVGVLAKTHVVPVSQLIDNTIQTGVSSLVEVYWNKIRTPAPALVSPTDIAWLTVSNENDVDEEQETDDFDSDDDESQDVIEM